MSHHHRPRKGLSRRGFLKAACSCAAVGVGVGTGLLRGPRVVLGAEAEAQEFTLPEIDDAAIELVFRTAADGGAKFSEVYVEGQRRTGLTMHDGELTEIERSTRLGVGIRVWIGELQGYASAESLEPSELQRATKAALAIGMGEKVQGIAPKALGSRKIQARRGFRVREPFELVELGALRAYLGEAHRAAKAEEKVKNIEVSYRDEVTAFRVLASDGLRMEDTMPMISLGVRATAIEGDQRGNGYARAAGRVGIEFFQQESPAAIAQAAVKQALANLEAKPAPTGTMPVVIGNRGGVLFHEAIGHGLEGDSIVQETSIFSGLVGSKVASELVTVRDDATLRGLRGSYNIDGEGMPGRNNILVEKGKLRGYLWDRKQAAKANGKSTGNGRRESFSHLPQPRMSNTFLDNGDSDPSEIIKSTKRGLYCAAFGGGQVNSTTGEFTFNVTEGYLIEDGKLTAPVQGASLVGTGIEVLRNIDMVGNDLGFWAGTCGKGGQWVPVTAGSPTLRVKEMAVGGISESSEG